MKENLDLLVNFESFLRSATRGERQSGKDKSKFGEMVKVDKVHCD